MPDLKEIQQQLASLRTEFSSSLILRVEQMITDINTLPRQSNPARYLKKLFRQIHSLSGSAGTFGFHRLSEQCRQLELMLMQFINEQSLPDAKTIDSIRLKLQKLYHLISDGPDEQHSSNTQPAFLPDQIKRGRQVYVVEDDSVHGRELCLQLNHHGFKTRLFGNVTATISALEQEKPDALVLDITLPEGLLAGIDLAPLARQLQKEPIPCVFISAQKGWGSRLAAVRVGGTAYLDKPVDALILVDHLERITQRVPSKPYRVLVVDDMLEMAQHYSLILRQAGMYTEVLTEPAEILQKLETFQPELILLDFYFPDISGLDIAQVLRQHQTHFSIPIVFLSSEANPDIQLKTLQQGDDFLEKPVLNKQLVSTLESRIERARELSQLMYHDGLTGLLNQVTLQHRLEAELSRSQRQVRTLSYIMLDLDHFKQVNDRYGHAAGDRVLRSLAQLLKGRLRKSDLIGRYGGEEFGIIMPDTGADTAHQIMEDLRLRFTGLSCPSNGQEFSCSFSAGIACSAAFDEGKSLIEAANAALYLAKEKGRNQIMLHPACQ